MTLLHAISYLGTLGLFLFAVLSLASGLLWIAEVIEEHSSIAKVVGRRLTYAIIVLHVLLCYFDGLPLVQTLFSIGCHIIYLQNMSTQWPVISLTSISFIASSICCFVDHFLWFSYFSHLAQEARQWPRRYRGPRKAETPSFADVSTFFVIFVWLVPLFLFLSLSASDNSLPRVASNPQPANTFPNVTTHKSIYRTLFSYFPRIRQRRELDSILALHSPFASAPVTPSLYHVASTTSVNTLSQPSPTSPSEKRPAFENVTDNEHNSRSHLSAPPRDNVYSGIPESSTSSSTHEVDAAGRSNLKKRPTTST